MKFCDEEPIDDGVTVEPCEDEPLFARMSVEKIQLGAHSKPKLDAAINDAAKAGWRVAVRSHCSESGRHQAKLFRPLNPINPINGRAHMASPRKTARA